MVCIHEPNSEGLAIAYLTYDFTIPLVYLETLRGGGKIRSGFRFVIRMMY